MDLYEVEEEEYYAMSRPKYSIILQEEDYEDEECPQGYDKSPEDNYDRGAVETWDPWEPAYFFPIQ
jgi:hypothetical protein